MEGVRVTALPAPRHPEQGEETESVREGSVLLFDTNANSRSHAGLAGLRLRRGILVFRLHCAKHVFLKKEILILCAVFGPGIDAQNA